jgi:hypothetical protein
MVLFAVLGISRSAASAGETFPSRNFVYNIIQKSCVVCVPGHLRVQEANAPNEKSHSRQRERENKVLLFVAVRDIMILFSLHNERKCFKLLVPFGNT